MWVSIPDHNKGITVSALEDSQGSYEVNNFKGRFESNSYIVK